MATTGRGERRRGLIIAVVVVVILDGLIVILLLLILPSSLIPSNVEDSIIVIDDMLPSLGLEAPPLGSWNLVENQKATSTTSSTRAKVKVV